VKKKGFDQRKKKEKKGRQKSIWLLAREKNLRWLCNKESPKGDGEQK